MKKTIEKERLYTGEHHRKHVAEMYKMRLKKDIIINTHRELQSVFEKETGRKIENGMANGKSVKAFVNHGRWIARCECGGCEIVDVSLDHNAPQFYCFSCGNKEYNGKLRKILFPRNIEEIEKELLKRKENKHRNWEPKESIARLIEERETYDL